MAGAELVDSGLRALGRAAGVDLRLDPEHRCRIGLDGGVDLMVEVDEAGGMLHLHAELIRLPAEKGRIVVLERALALNLYGRATQGATLALDEASDAILLCHWRPLAGMDPAGFASLFSNFVDALEQVRAALIGDASSAEGEHVDVHGHEFPDFRFRA